MLVHPLHLCHPLLSGWSVCLFKLIANILKFLANFLYNLKNHFSVSNPDVSESQQGCMHNASQQLGLYHMWH